VTTAASCKPFMSRCASVYATWTASFAAVSSATAHRNPARNKDRYKYQPTKSIQTTLARTFNSLRLPCLLPPRGINILEEGGDGRPPLVRYGDRPFKVDLRLPEKVVMCLKKGC